MKPALLIVLAALSLTACDPQPGGEPVVRAELDGTSTPVAQTEVVPEEVKEEEEAAPVIASACEPVTFESASLTHCTADPKLHTIKTALAPSRGDSAGTIAGWAAGRDESKIAFVMNAGMYGDDLKPIGYFVEDSDRLEELNRSDGSGNFFLKPNGVFFGSNGRWRVLDADTFLRTIGDRPKFGTQSGPMLVINGKLHPEIAEDGASLALRNGVGVDSAGKAHFVISDEPLSFGKLGRYFRDELKTSNALFLDGNVSSLWDPATGRMDGRRVGTLLVVETK